MQGEDNIIQLDRVYTVRMLGKVFFLSQSKLLQFHTTATTATIPPLPPSLL